MPQRTIDFNKIQWAEYWYENQFGESARTRLMSPSVHGVMLGEPNAYALPHPDYPHETVIERARRLGILDKWTAVCQFIITANRTLTFRGDDATKKWRAYNKHVYS